MLKNCVVYPLGTPIVCVIDKATDDSQSVLAKERRKKMTRRGFCSQSERESPW